MLAPALKAQTCFRGHPSPACSGFTVLEFTAATRLNPKEGRTDGSSAYGYWSFGYLKNTSARDAVGAALQLSSSFPGPRPVPLSLTKLLRTSFPITQHLGVRVLRDSPALVELGAPLAPNRNRSGTAFAGSLNALATLAGWAAVTLLLQRHGEADAQLVLQDSTITYLRPATKAFRAACAAPGPRETAAFLEALRRRKRARIRITVELSTDDGPTALYAGRYVAQRLPAPHRS